MTIKLSEQTRKAAVEAVTNYRPYAHPLLRRMAGLTVDTSNLFLCANIASTGLHTVNYYTGGKCGCCAAFKDQDTADELYAEMKRELDERAPA